MRYLFWVCALAAAPGLAMGQQPDTTIRQPPGVQAVDSLQPAREPDCRWQGPAPISAPAGASRVSSSQGTASDSLCLTRREAILGALTYNPQLQVAAE
jgi:hypothetical protein